MDIRSNEAVRIARVKRVVLVPPFSSLARATRVALEF